MLQTLDEIAELAEFIAEDNITRGIVNLDKIARKNDIGLHYDNFENYFTGMLQHENNSFDIFINLYKLKKKKYSRTRFTLAHELGHYYIDAHRNLLKKGYSLSYDKDLSYFSNDPVEKEANHFATNLLMPKNRFVNDINSQEVGINAVKNLSQQYKTSITSTIIQYRNLINNPCFLLFWNENQEFKRKNYSDSFYNIIKQFSQGFKIKDEIKASIFDGFDDLLYFRNTTSIDGYLSSFYVSINVSSTMDKPVKIETMNLQSYGFVSIVFLSDI
jgi:Zn-dependent peptidase ImmA (M78 family)